MSKITFSILLTIVFFNTILSQTSADDTTTKLSEYFKLERENIHLHLNKNTYLTTEDIWFKGYIIEKKSKAPFFTTSNVYISLIDDKGTKIETKLHFSENSVFNGTIKLNKTFKTGKYYIQVYTNYMNNFSEDESSVFEINIINPNEGNIIDDKKINYATLDMEFFPESGIFLEGILNVIGVKISDCNDNGLSFKDIEVIDSKGTSISMFSTDTNGYGRLSLNPDKNETYKVVLKFNDNKIEKTLPKPTSNGMSLSVNNYSVNGKTLISIKTNSTSVDALKNKTHLLVVQHNEVSSTIPFTFKDGENQKTIAIANDKLIEGLIVLNVINSEGKKVNERIIFNPILEQNKVDALSNSRKNDSIVISGRTSLLMGNISVSVLPDNDYSEPNKSIYNTLLFNNFLSNSVKNINYYLTDFSKTKHSELDNLLITQTSKYELDKIIAKLPPEKKYEFDNGLILSGTVNNNIQNNDENYTVTINSLALGLNENVKLNLKNEFKLENVLAIDSTAVHFTLLDKKAKATELNVYCNVLNNNKKFYKPFIPKLKQCASNNIVILDNFVFPKIDNVVLLDEIAIEAQKKKDALSKTTKFNNSSIKGYKITNDQADIFRDVLSFIRSHGFNVTESGGNVFITRTYSTSFGGSNSPTIYLDDFPIPADQFNTLRNMNLNTIDEIYINKTGFGGGINGSNGIIRIFNKPVANSISNIKIKSKPYYIKNGFQPNISYKNPQFANAFDESFKQFGTIFWLPNVNTNESGDFKFLIPNLNQKTIKIVFEGISSDGKLISEVKTISIN